MTKTGEHMWRFLEVRDELDRSYSDVLSPIVAAVLEALAPLNGPRKAIMDARIARRAARARNRERIQFLDPESTIAGTNISVKDARDGNFEGSEIPECLRRQWIHLASAPGREGKVGLRAPLFTRPIHSSSAERISSRSASAGGNSPQSSSRATARNSPSPRWPART